MSGRITNLLSYGFAMVKRFVLLPFAKARYHGKQIWLVCERGTDARDNGYHMFRYLRKEHPETDAWYIITKDSVDFDKVNSLGNVVPAGSLQHWMLYIVAEKILTAFEPHFCPSPSHRFYKYIRKKNHQAIVFLQHGVIGNDLPLYHQERSGFDIFICGAKPEYDYVSRTFNYTHGEVRYTGLARFDALHNLETKRQLLIMPTYRKWFRNQTTEEVAGSDYVRLWQSLLCNPRLTELTEKYDFDVVFYPHALMQDYIKLFSSTFHRIIIADSRKYDVQPLLTESAMMITDYSSVQFDFAYMEKPMVYYQFDETEVFDKHVGRGYFDYRESGFGEMAETEERLLSLIGEYADSGFMLKPLYRHRIEGFFPLHDNHNCERIYREIVTT